MPSRPQPTIGQQLAKLLVVTDISQRELGRRLTAGATNDPEYRDRWDAQTRWVQKVIKGKVSRPTNRKLDAIELAAERPGYFKRPVRPSPQAKEDEIALLRRRLEEVEDRASRDVLALRTDLTQAIERIVVLEQRSARGPRRASEGGP